MLMKRKIIHVMVNEKFIPPFIDFVNKEFKVENHEFLIFGKKEISKYNLKHKNIHFIGKLNFIFTIYKFFFAEKIIIHGLWHEGFIKTMLFLSWLQNKCFWIMWGGDFYFPQDQSNSKAKLISKISHFVTFVEGDFEYVKHNYGATGSMHFCISYLSNVFESKLAPIAKNKLINVQIGNSADPSNNQLEVFEKIKVMDHSNVRLFAPLSYSDRDHANIVKAKGDELFKDRFVAMLDFVPYQEYQNYLASIDIAIFNHDRQQAMGNIVSLLGMGKKVFMKKTVSSWKFFQSIGVVIYDVEKLDLQPLDEELAIQNKKIIEKYFSYNSLREQLRRIFDFEFQ